MSIEIINQLKRILRGVTALQNVIFNHHKRHEAGGGDEVSVARAVYNTYSGQDSLDATYPFELLFEIVSEMTAIQSVKLSFKIRNYRAYAKEELPLGGGHTTPLGGGKTSSETGTPSGGGHTTPLGGGHTTPSGGATNSGYTSHSHSANTTTTGTHGHGIDAREQDTSYVSGHVHRYQWTSAITMDGGSHYHSVSLTGGSHRHSCPSHKHIVSNHTHTVSHHTHPAHSHTVPNHQHTVSHHQHTLNFGIYEKAESPTINVYIDNGAGYGEDPIDTYTEEQLDIDITDHISGTGLKQVKFTSDKMTGIAAHVLCKVALAT